jgi:hypothetical protein
MGGGNGQKSAKAREKAQAKAAKGGAGSMLKANEAAKSIQCKVCMQAFVSTLSHSELKKHAENKHPKLVAKQCFPFLE